MDNLDFLSFINHESKLLQAILVLLKKTMVLIMNDRYSIPAYFEHC